MPAATWAFPPPGGITIIDLFVLRTREAAHHVARRLLLASIEPQDLRHELVPLVALG